MVEKALPCLYLDRVSLYKRERGATPSVVTNVPTAIDIAHCFHLSTYCSIVCGTAFHNGEQSKK